MWKRRGGTQKILGHPGVTCDLEHLVTPVPSLPPSILPAPLPSPLVYLRPFLPSQGIIPGAAEVWGSSWLPAWKGSIGSGLDKEKMEGSMVKRKIDLVMGFL